MKMAAFHSMMARCDEPISTREIALTPNQSGELLDNYPAHEDGMQVTDLQWSPDRTYFITSSKDKTAKVAKDHCFYKSD